MLVVGATVGAVLLVDHWAHDLPVLRFVASVFFLKASFALNALGNAGSRVARALETGDVPARSGRAPVAVQSRPS